MKEVNHEATQLLLHLLLQVIINPGRKQGQINIKGIHIPIKESAGQVPALYPFYGYQPLYIAQQPQVQLVPIMQPQPAMVPYYYGHGIQGHHQYFETAKRRRNKSLKKKIREWDKTSNLIKEKQEHLSKKKNAPCHRKTTTLTSDYNHQTKRSPNKASKEKSVVCDISIESKYESVPSKILDRTDNNSYRMMNTAEGKYKHSSQRIESNDIQVNPFIERNEADSQIIQDLSVPKKEDKRQIPSSIKDRQYQSVKEELQINKQSDKILNLNSQNQIPVTQRNDELQSRKAVVITIPVISEDKENTSISISEAFSKRRRETLIKQERRNSLDKTLSMTNQHFISTSKQPKTREELIEIRKRMRKGPSQVTEAQRSQSRPRTHHGNVKKVGNVSERKIHGHSNSCLDNHGSPYLSFSGKNQDVAVRPSGLTSLTHQQTLEQRLAVLRKQVKRNTDNEERSVSKNDKSNLLERLARGEKAKVPRKEMLEQTKRRYKKLPEVVQKDIQTLKREASIVRIAKAKEFGEVNAQ